MSTCNNVTRIFDSECIGESLVKINTNFSNLDFDLCQLGTDLMSLSAFVRSLSVRDSSTIDMAFSVAGYFLSADVVNNSLGTSKLGEDIPTTTKNFLTAAKVSSLIDTTISNPQINQVLTWSGTRWVNQSITDQVGAKVLNDLNDVTITSPSNNQTLVYDGTLNQWINRAQDVPNVSVLGGNYGDITVSGNGLAWTINPLVVNEGKIASNAITELKIANNAVSNIKLANALACSIKGNATGATAAITDIQATTDNRVLIRSSGTLQFGTVPNGATTAISTSSPNTIVLRDSSNNFSAGTITAALNGRATTAGFADSANTANTATRANQLTTPRTIFVTGAVTGQTTAPFDGTGNVTINTAFATAPGSSGSADKLTYRRNIKLTGNATGEIQPKFDGSDPEYTIDTTVNYSAAAGTANLAYTANVANSATKLQTPRTIFVTGAVTGQTTAPFDGTGNVTINTAFAAAPGSSGSADKLTYRRNIKLTGDATGEIQPKFDGSDPEYTINTTVNYSAAAGTADSAGRADRLTTSRSISLTGKATGTTTANFDGQNNATINVTAVAADKVVKTVALAGEITGTAANLNVDVGAVTISGATAGPTIITNRTAKTTLNNNDQFLFYDSSDTNLKKITAELMRNYLNNIPYARVYEMAGTYSAVSTLKLITGASNADNQPAQIILPAPTNTTKLPFGTIVERFLRFEPGQPQDPSNTLRFDTIGMTFDSNGTITFPSGGVYEISLRAPLLITWSSGVESPIDYTLEQVSGNVPVLMGTPCMTKPWNAAAVITYNHVLQGRVNIPTAASYRIRIRGNEGGITGGLREPVSAAFPSENKATLFQLEVWKLS